MSRRRLAPSRAPEGQLPLFPEAADAPASQNTAPRQAESVPTWAVPILEYHHNLLYILKSFSQDNQASGRQKYSACPDSKLQKRYTHTQLTDMTQAENIRTNSHSEDRLRAARHMLGAYALTEAGCTYFFGSTEKAETYFETEAKQMVDELSQQFTGKNQAALPRQEYIKRIEACIETESSHYSPPLAS